ncbi:histone deacetylase family protein [Kiloniella laminariae]|uniref:Histone deacetylase family protein n=1 Tax=Kiloniella laminariae TaxID=454162 RepID=A0ABT4LNV1_9PROT|nr:histone deacetylase family protein [Kiloniella laminariae]MCZ4282570.1 histone deacetylase family protein [Kiloniella laminariae]
MKYVFDERQKGHDPKHFFANGVALPNPEQPERVRLLQKGAQASGCEPVQAKDYGLGPIAAIHSAEYLAFLETIHLRWQRIDGSSDEVIPNIHPMTRSANYPKSAVGQAGYHQADTACPISSGTWEAAYWSAQTALTGVDLINGGEKAAYALCRPPGHHAFADLAGGFCFLNNSAIAAEQLLRAGRRPAILDIDVHHGNGTQGIFYERKDVLTLSIHADPDRFYPFFWGGAQERGEGEGAGYNLNLPLPRGTGDDDYLITLEKALARINSFGADVLVVALGLDPYEKDPLQGFSITTSGFSRIAGAIKTLNLPTLLVQEGGYLCEELSDNLASFLQGFES